MGVDTDIDCGAIRLFSPRIRPSPRSSQLSPLPLASSILSIFTRFSSHLCLPISNWNCTRILFTNTIWRNSQRLWISNGLEMKRWILQIKNQLIWLTHKILVDFGKSRKSRCHCENKSNIPPSGINTPARKGIADRGYLFFLFLAKIIISFSSCY